MNDRASAVPPVNFLGAADEFAALERPVAAEVAAAAAAPAAATTTTTTTTTTTRTRPISQVSNASSSARTNNSSGGGKGSSRDRAKAGSSLLGQMWDGVRGRLRMRREMNAKTVEEDEDEEDRRRGEAREKEREREREGAAAAAAAAARKGELPSKEEVFENYQQLVNSGFFASHAIQSTRQPGPPSSRRCVSRPPTTTSTRPATTHANTSNNNLRPNTAHGHALPPTGPPHWPLPPTPFKAKAGAPLPLCSPASISRGTKRAAAADYNHDHGDDDKKQDGPAAAAAAAAQPSMPKKLRKMPSREIAVPKLRSVASRRAILASKRSASSAAPAPAPASVALAEAPREPNRLTKRLATPRLPPSRPPVAGVPARGSSAWRNFSEGQGQGQGKRKAPPEELNTTRVLRPRRSAEPLSVVPDANHGVPRVPTIPPKFTYGEDRENDGPWRGLRR